jgi:hypothetical protein
VYPWANRVPLARNVRASRARENAAVAADTVGDRVETPARGSIAGYFQLEGCPLNTATEPAEVATSESGQTADPFPG